MEPLLQLDAALVRAINGMAGRSAILDWLMIACARYAPVVFALLLVALWLSWRTRYQRAAALAGVAALVALGIGQLVGHAFPRLRPYEAPGLGHIRLLVPHSADTSFPSDHTTLAFAVTVALWAVDRRLGVASLLFSLWLCVARVFIGAHYPSDVIGGAVLGTLVAVVILRLDATAPVHASVDRVLGALHRVHLAAIPESQNVH
ncbi:MAG TPA: phosphatase PAP2 family protein [Gemmatimonadaceae bacterium]